MKKILGTGLLGLVGSRIVEVLGYKYEFENLSRRTGTNVLNESSVFSAIQKSNAEIVIHLAAKTNVDECEVDKEKDLELYAYKTIQKDQELSETAWTLNVLGTQYVRNACKQLGKKLIFVSTDFVFDGKNPKPGGYTEEDSANPINWYAVTKLEGEKIVTHYSNSAIIRIGYPYSQSLNDKDFVHGIIKRLSAGERVSMIQDQIITPAFIDDVGLALDAIITQNATGIYHASGSQSLSPIECGMIIVETLGFDKSKIHPILREEFYKSRAPRPFQLIMNNDKIQQLGVYPRTFQEGVVLLKNAL